MKSLQGIKVTRRGSTILIPLPKKLWRLVRRDTPCKCGHCDGIAFWDTLAVDTRQSQDAYGRTWRVHAPELQK